ncbi:MAG: response regulator [Pseudomonadota bacterium]
MGRILVVEDDPQVRDVIIALLESADHEACGAGDGASAVALGRSGQFDLAIIDLILPEQDGLAAIRELRRRVPRLQLVAISGGGRVGFDEYLQTAAFVGADATLAKPFRRDELLTTVDALLDEALFAANS